MGRKLYEKCDRCYRGRFTDASGSQTKCIQCDGRRFVEVRDRSRELVGAIIAALAVRETHAPIMLAKVHRLFAELDPIEAKAIRDLLPIVAPGVVELLDPSCLVGKGA